MLRALEFYSGIGAFAQAGRSLDFGQNIAVLRAYDQNAAANETYKLNWGEKPCAINLDSIAASQLPVADLWWMSPPCTPYSRRGARKDIDDKRAASFLHLIEFMLEKKPQIIIIENVEGFLDSRVHIHLKERLGAQYCLSSVALCSSQFGVPMLRPRVFVVATREGHKPIEAPAARKPMALSAFVDSSNDIDERLWLAPEQAQKYEAVLNVVDPGDPESYSICFTSGYLRCRKAGGSMLRMADRRLRFFAPTEILKLLGFSADFQIPASVSMPAAYKLVGNSVDVRVIRHILNGLYSQGVFDK